MPENGPGVYVIALGFNTVALPVLVESVHLSPLLAQAIVREGMRALDEGANPMLLRRGIEEATACLVTELQRTARPIEGRASAHFGPVGTVCVASGGRVRLLSRMASAGLASTFTVGTMAAR